jgi:hypothetical protein
VYLDIYAADLAGLEALGATIVEPRRGARTWTVMAEPVARELVRTGALTQEEGGRLLADLHERAANGRYFLARTYYTAIATAA